jgi:hypothetical protein
MSYTKSIIDTYVKKKKYYISFTHVPTTKSTSFPAFLKSFSDNYNASWNEESVFGRMDPIYTYQITSRSISFSITIPSADEIEAEANLSSIRELSKYLYPTFQNNRNATTISKAPLVRIKFSNLISKGSQATGNGLLGKIQSISINPNVEVGFFDVGLKLFPKELSLDIEFDVLHETDPASFEEDKYEDFVVESDLQILGKEIADSGFTKDMFEAFKGMESDLEQGKLNPDPVAAPAEPAATAQSEPNQPNQAQP